MRQVTVVLSPDEVRLLEGLGWSLPEGLRRVLGAAAKAASIEERSPLPDDPRPIAVAQLASWVRRWEAGP